MHNISPERAFCSLNGSNFTKTLLAADRHSNESSKLLKTVYKSNQFLFQMLEMTTKWKCATLGSHKIGWCRLACSFNFWTFHCKFPVSFYSGCAITFSVGCVSSKLSLTDLLIFQVTYQSVILKSTTVASLFIWKRSFSTTWWHRATVGGSVASFRTSTLSHSPSSPITWSNTFKIIMEST